MRLQVFLLLICVSCAVTPPPSNTIRKYERLINDYPDSALTILYDMPSEALSKREKAQHALLISMALDKNYYDIASDSIIKPAISYYASHGHHREKMLTKYYEALIRKNAEEYTPAIVALEEAEKYAQKLGDNHYLGLINRNKASVFSSTNNFPAAIEYRKKAVNYFKLANDVSYLDFAVYSLAVEYSLNGDYDLALNTIQQLVEKTNIQSIVYRGRLLEATILIESNNNLNQAMDLYRSVPDNYLSFIDGGYKAVAYESLGQKASSEMWLEWALSKAHDQADSSTIEYMKSQILYQRGKYKEAFSLLDHATSVQDSLTRTILQESISGAQRDFFKEDALRQEENASRSRIWFIIILIVAILLFSISYTLFRLKSTQKEQKLKEIMAELAIGSDTIKRLNIDNASLIGKLFSEHLLNLNQLSKEYFGTEVAKQKEAVFNSFKKNVEELHANADLFAKLEEDLNRFCNDIMKKLRTQVPSIKGIKIKLVILFFIQTPYKVIELIMKGHSVDSLKMARSRLRKEIINSQAPDKELFLEMLKIK